MLPKIAPKLLMAAAFSAASGDRPSGNRLWSLPAARPTSAGPRALSKRARHLDPLCDANTGANAYETFWLCAADASAPGDRVDDTRGGSNRRTFTIAHHVETKPLFIRYQFDQRRGQPRAKGDALSTRRKTNVGEV